MAIQINTSIVATTADFIDVMNKKIRDELLDVEAAICSLQNCWEGNASTTGVNKYDYIKGKFSETRFSVMNEMVLFMRLQVGEGYETTEQVISTAASAFK